MSIFKENLIYKCISKGPLMVRRLPDDKSQAISVVRPGMKVKCLGMRDGIIFKIPVEKSFRTKDIWMKINKGFVRVVSLNGLRKHFELSDIEKQLTICTVKNTQAGDIIMVTPGAVNPFGIKPPNEFYAPATHKVLAIDGTGHYLYLGKAMDDGTWYNLKDCVLVKKATDKDKKEIEMGK